MAKSHAAVAAAVAGAIAGGVYLATLAPTVGFSDSGELTTAAAGLGVPHPPGVPLFVLVTYPFTLLAFSSVAARVNLASAVFGASAVATLAVVAYRFTTSRGAERESRARSVPIPLVASVTGALLFACCRTTWFYATIAEVYMLSACMTLVVWLLLWQERIQAAALIFGFALGSHPPMHLSMLPAMAVLVYRTSGAAYFTSRQFMRVALIAMSGLAIYGYLPLAALRDPAVNWSDPSTLERFWAHVTGQQYRAGLEMANGAWGLAAARFGGIASQQLALM